MRQTVHAYANTASRICYIIIIIIILLYYYYYYYYIIIIIIIICHFESCWYVKAWIESTAH